MSINTAQVAAVVATVVAQVPTAATVPAAIINADVLTLLSKLESEVVVAAKFVEQVAENNAVVTRTKNKR
jgi:hypothetical protein